jgi:hypothetical protein
MAEVPDAAAGEAPAAQIYRQKQQVSFESDEGWSEGARDPCRFYFGRAGAQQLLQSIPVDNSKVIASASCRPNRHPCMCTCSAQPHHLGSGLVLVQFAL